MVMSQLAGLSMQFFFYLLETLECFLCIKYDLYLNNMLKNVYLIGPWVVLNID